MNKNYLFFIVNFEGFASLLEDMAGRKRADQRTAFLHMPPPARPAKEPVNPLIFHSISVAAASNALGLPHQILDP